MQSARRRNGRFGGYSSATVYWRSIRQLEGGQLSFGVWRPLVTAMNEPELTEREKRYLDDLRDLPTSVRSRLMGWALELALSIGIFAYGLTAERRLFLVLGFISLLYFAVWRMYSQFRGFRMLSSIYKKQLAAEKAADA